MTEIYWCQRNRKLGHRHSQRPLTSMDDVTDTRPQPPPIRASSWGHGLRITSISLWFRKGYEAE